MRLHLPSLVAAASLAALSIAGAQQQQGAAPQRPIDRANLDTTCAACTNFYQFANGGWLKSAKIPPAYARWGSFEMVNDRNQSIVHDVIEEDAKNLATEKPGSNEWKIGTYYAACMDTTAIDALGTKPLQHVFDRIARISSRDDLTRALGDLEHSNGLAPFLDGTGPDAKNSNVVVTVVGQGGLGLPSKDFYTQDRWSAIREKYVAHIANMMVLLGDSPAVAKEEAARVLAVESRFAAASMAPAEMRDPKATYNKMPLDDLQKLTPHFDWKRFFAQQGVKRPIDSVDVLQPAFFRAFDVMLDSIPVADWRAYLRWRAVHETASTLASPIATENFRFMGQELNGQKERQPRWKTCTAQTNGALGEAVGQGYVKRAFSPEAKARVMHIIDNLQAALHDRIQTLDWMSDTTKARALDKLAAYKRKIGYPDKWRDYGTLPVKPKAYHENVVAAANWNQADNWNRLGKPVDKTEWQMTPPVVNAYYTPLNNEIVFPAGILQPPFFDPSADDAVNYGSMGAVIGHEMSHGFDDQGRQYDKDGNLADWWTKDDADRYLVQAGRVVDQFNAYTVVDSATHVNGKLTLGENIGDLGGLAIAYAAMEKDLAAKGRPAPIDGFTPEQRFFLAWAQLWRNLITPQAAKSLLARDPHPPGEWRVNGPLSNMPEFKAAWGCKDGDTMVRPDSLRARIW